jgi:hypothetical protein
VESFGLHGMVSAMLRPKVLSRLMRRVGEALEAWKLINGKLGTSNIVSPALEEVDYDSLEREIWEKEEMEEKLRSALFSLGKRATH